MKNERGFALIATMWLLVVIGAVGLELSLAARDRRLTALNVSERAQAEWAAKAGLETAHARLDQVLVASQRSPDPWWNASAFLPDSVHEAEWGFRVTASDPDGKLNINSADEQELQRLFAALEINATKADSLAQTIADWRDPDDLHRPRGAERSAYLAVEAPVLPRNAPFRSVRELLDVMGITPAIYSKVAPFLTVSGTGQVNLNAAPRAVLLALPGIGDEAAAVIQNRRTGGKALASLNDLSDLLSTPAKALLQANVAELMIRASFETRELELISTGWTGDRRSAVTARGLLARARTSSFLFGVTVE
jgi:general secretion pathway protein K